MESIKSTLTFLYDNWTMILICLGLIVGIAKKTVSYFSASKAERIEIAKKQVEQAILRMITDAEKDYQSWQSAGAIKRSQVIEEIFAEYPILSKAIDQQALITWIDEQIDNALVELRRVIEENETK